MTARRSSATERGRSVFPLLRPAAILLALASVAATATGCASRNANSQAASAMLLPGNQATGPSSKPPPPPSSPPPTKPPPPPKPPSGTRLGPPPTTTTITGSWTDDQAAVAAMGHDVFTQVPLLRGSPTENPASPLPQLEIVTMPMWLWVDPATDLAHVPNGATTHTVIVRTVADTAHWTLDSAGSPLVNCGVGPTPPPNRGPGMPYLLGLDPFNTTNPVPQACIYTNLPTPYYSTSAGVTVAGVHQFTAAVTWHVEYKIIDDGTGGIITDWTPANPPIAGNAPSTANNPLTFRVGEIQALVTGP
jgi:hypothetical protein